MRLGIDMGGTKIEILALGNNGQELFRERVPTPKSSYEDILLSIKDLVEATEEKLNQVGTVGIGIPGMISASTGLVKNANTRELVGKPFDKDLSQLLDREVRVTNDANCFTLSEAVDGAAAGCHSVFGIILGTGCGGGLVIDGKVLNGANSIAGEWGHNRLGDTPESEFKDRPCYCGHKGCNETFISGTGFETDYFLQTGKRLMGKEIVAQANAGNKEAIANIDRLGTRLAKALSVVINIVDPEAIVFGGGLSNIKNIYQDVKDKLPQYVFSDTVETKILKAKYGDSSGVRGAAWLWS